MTIPLWLFAVALTAALLAGVGIGLRVRRRFSDGTTMLNGTEVETTIAGLPEPSAEQTAGTVNVPSSRGWGPR